MPLVAACAWCLLAIAPAQADWRTCRGNSQRTGCTDGKVGPASPVVLWAYTAQEHYAGSPVVDGGRLYLPGLGAFNTGVFHAVDASSRSDRRTVWSLSAPYVTRPTVCSPAVAGGLVIFGDGMHQTDDAILYAVQAGSGMPLWRYDVPGKLIHMEGSPTVEGDKVYIGAGDGGVLCLDAARVTLDGQEVDAAAARDAVAKKWEDLQAKYQEARKKDPQFAVAPRFDDLPKAKPKLLWQSGAKQWHVDAPVAVQGNRLLVASAYLDDEKVGKRALLCLRAADGTGRWETPLEINPWAGPTVADSATVLVGCSSVRFDPEAIDKAKGEIVAVNFQDGKVRWRREMPGGVLSSVAAGDGLAVCATTGGKIVACDLGSGDVKWTYSGGTPFFGAPALAGAVAYAADLKGVLHAVRLFDGKQLWTFDVLTDKAVLAPGMFFGSPVVHEGRIYLASCNALSKEAGRPSAVVCVTDKAEIADIRAAVRVEVDRVNGRIVIPCRIAPRKLANLTEVYPIEVIATYPSPRGQKAHETVVTFQVTPSDVHKAMEELGLKAGVPAKGATNVASGPQVGISLLLPSSAGPPRLVPIEAALVDRLTDKSPPPLRWLFTGSATQQPDPQKDQRIYGADASGTLIALFPVTDETVFQSTFTMREEGMLKLDTNLKLLPPEGTAVKMVIDARPRTATAPAEDVPAGPRPFLAANPLPPLIASPLAYEEYGLAGLSLRLPLPAVRAAGPGLVGVEPLRPLPLRSEADTPPLASSPWTLEMARGPLAARPPARAAGPDVRVPLLPGRTGYDAGSTDTRGLLPDAGLLAAVAARPPLVELSAPFLRLRLPDPFEDAAAMSTAGLPTESQSPATPQRGEMPRPTLAVPPPPATDPASRPASPPASQPAPK
jgi:outer membrane protein assembly factor BamB